MVDVTERDLSHLVIVQDPQEDHQGLQEDLPGPQDRLKPKRREHQAQEAVQQVQEAVHQVQEDVPQAQGIGPQAQEGVATNHQDGRMTEITQEAQTKIKEDKKNLKEEK